MIIWCEIGLQKSLLPALAYLLVGGSLEWGLRLLPEPNATANQAKEGQQGFMRDDYALQWIPQEGTLQQRVDPYDRPFVLRINASGKRGADLEPRQPQQRQLPSYGLTNQLHIGTVLAYVV